MIDISIRGLSAQLNAEIAYLKVFLQVEKDTGFTQADKVIELLSVELFRAAKIADFTNANLIKVNFPAIDLHEPQANGQGIAAQVTSSATAAKINKTIREFEKPRTTGALINQYSKLYILGLLKVAKKYPTGRPYCEVLSFNDLIQKVVARNDPDAMYDAIHAIRTHIQRPVLLQPSQDIPALMITLGFLNRSAITHHMHQEGNVRDMVKGLNELREVIGKGSARGKSITKAASDYFNPDITIFLNNVSTVISRITGMVNGAINGGYSLSTAQAQEIDSMKASIVHEANAISAKLNINFMMAMV